MSTPKDGYILKLWNQKGYRATAIAYMQREKLTEVEHINGDWYTLQQLEKSVLRYHNPSTWRSKTEH